MKPARNRIRFRDARTALRRLQADPGRTDAVFEIVGALSGGQPRRLLGRIRRDPEGGRLLRERPLFDPRHADMEALERLPAGSFGSEDYFPLPLENVHASSESSRSRRRSTRTRSRRSQ